MVQGPLFWWMFVGMSLSVMFHYLLSPVRMGREAGGKMILGEFIPLLPIVRLLNVVLEPWKDVLIPVDRSTVTALATSRGVNLTYFADRDDQLYDEESLRLYLESVGTEMTPVGRFFARDKMANHLALQMRLLQLLEQHPEIEDEVIEAPIIITGLPRSGTTYFYQVIADAFAGSVRFPLSWEAYGGPGVCARA